MRPIAWWGAFLRLFPAGARGKVHGVVEPGGQRYRFRVRRVALQHVDVVENGGEMVDGVVPPLRLRPAPQQVVGVVVRVGVAGALAGREQGLQSAGAQGVEVGHGVICSGAPGMSAKAPGRGGRAARPTTLRHDPHTGQNILKRI